MISLKNVTKKYNDKTVLENFSFDFPKKGFVCITGPNGSGKTTLIRLILGLEMPDAGSINLEKNISVVFQEDRLLQERTALFNVMLATKDSQKATAILQKLGLANELHTLTKDLSGGMARRVAIARALAKDACVYIMDEPLNSLDVEIKKQTLELIHEYTDKSEKLLIMITHDKESCENADKIIILGK